MEASLGWSGVGYTCTYIILDAPLCFIYIDMRLNHVLDNFLQLDKKILEQIAIGAELPDDVSLIKHWCKYEERDVNVTSPVNQTVTRMINYTNGDASWILLPQNVTALVNETVSETRKIPLEACKFTIMYLLI